MRIMFGNWKYMFKNLWYVLPVSVVPAVFIALSLDYTAIGVFSRDFFTGSPRMDFVDLFRVWSLIRIDSALGAVYSALAVVCLVFFAALLMSIAEKHMRIGKRTLDGVGTQFARMILPTACITLLYVALYEVWAVVLSAMLFAVSAVKATALVYLFGVLVFLLVGFVFLYLVAVFFLWLPCMQITGFRPYDAFLYAYRLMAGVRWKIVFTIALSFGAGMALFAGVSFLPELVFRLVAFAVCLFLFPAFCLKMETVYFETDKIDREDMIRSYREL